MRLFIIVLVLIEGFESLQQHVSWKRQRRRGSSQLGSEVIRRKVGFESIDKIVDAAPSLDRQWKACEPKDSKDLFEYWLDLESFLNGWSKNDLKVCKTALEFAFLAHRGQLRRSGEPYISHPLAVAQILAETEMDRDAVVAGLLHDVVEDTSASFDDLETLFGRNVRKIVEGETKLSKIVTKRPRNNNNQEKSNDATTDTVKANIEAPKEKDKENENMRSMFVAMADDYRIVVVKLADRLHNMRTLQYMPPHKQQKIAQETLDIFAPLAHRLGIWQFKTELEEISFQYLQPIEFAKLDATIQRKLQTFDAVLADATLTLQKLVNGDAWLRGKVQSTSIEGRVKSVYSAYKKMRKYGMGVERVDDLVALRVVLYPSDEHIDDDASLCYHVLGRVHGRWTPMPKTMKDYVANPKPNGYQSLHTTVLVAGQPLEVQIRSSRMHFIAERGSAAHFLYKGATASLPWLESIRTTDAQAESAEAFMDIVRTNLLGTRVFVFDHYGRVLNLAKGATLRDALRLLSSQEDSTDLCGAINGVTSEPDTKLQNNDIVSLVHASEACTVFNGPLSFADDSISSTNTIHDKSQQLITNASAALDNEVRVVPGPAFRPSEGNGPKLRLVRRKKEEQSNGLCALCKPIPGDDAFFDKSGVLHRRGCSRLSSSEADPGTAKRRAAAFDADVVVATDGAKLGFASSFTVFCRDRTKMLLDISLAVSQVNIVDVVSETRAPRSLAAFSYTVNVPDLASLRAVVASVLAVDDVFQIVRGSIDHLKRDHGEDGFWRLASGPRDKFGAIAPSRAFDNDNSLS